MILAFLSIFLKHNFLCMFLHIIKPIEFVITADYKSDFRGVLRGPLNKSQNGVFSHNLNWFLTVLSYPVYS